MVRVRLANIWDYQIDLDESGQNKLKSLTRSDSFNMDSEMSNPNTYRVMLTPFQGREKIR